MFGVTPEAVLTAAVEELHPTSEYTEALYVRSYVIMTPVRKGPFGDIWMVV